MSSHRITQLLTMVHEPHQAGLTRGIGKAVLGAAGVAASLGLAGPDQDAAIAPPAAPPEFLASVRAAGISEPDRALLDEGHEVCRQIWTLHFAGSEAAAELARDDPHMSSDDASRFMLAAFNHLCPTPAGYGYWTE